MITDSYVLIDWYIAAKSKLSVVALTSSVSSNQNFFISTTDWIKEYDRKPKDAVILHYYKEYMKSHDLADKDRQMMFCFLHEIMGCGEFEKSLKGGTFSKVVTMSDEAFALFIMRDYDKIAAKEDRKKTN